MSWTDKPETTSEGLAVRPIADCPKCGRRDTFVDPQFRTIDWWTDKDGDSVEGPDYLEWACSRCGYTVHTATLDPKA